MADSVACSCKLLAAAGLVVAVCLAAPESPARYEVVDIGTLPWVAYDVQPRLSASGDISGWQLAPDGSISAAGWHGGAARDLGKAGKFQSSISSGLNSKGEIVGWSVSGKNLVDSLATTRAFVHADNRMTDVGTLGGGDTKAFAINQSGEVVGQSSLPDGTAHAFLFRAARLMDLGTLPGGGFSAAYAINKGGVIAGAAETSNHLVHAAMWHGGCIMDLGTLPGGSRSRALALNDNADAVGFSEAPQAEIHAFLYAGGRMQDLGSLGDDPVRANAINNHRQIVGASGVSRFVRHAFLWEDGRMQDLNRLIGAGSGWLLQEGNDINDQGQILCSGTRAGRDRHLLLLQPIAGAKPSN